MFHPGFLTGILPIGHNPVYISYRKFDFIILENFTGNPAGGEQTIKIKGRHGAALLTGS